MDAALDGSAVRTSMGDVSGWADRRCSLHPATIRGDVSGWPRAGGREPPAADVLPRGHPEVLPPARGPDPRPTGHVVPAGGTRPVHSQLSSPCGSRSGSLTEGAADLQSLDTGHGHARLGARTDGGVVSGHLPAGRSFPDHLGPPTPTLAWAGPPPTLTATPGGATVFPGGDTDIVDAHSSVWTVEAPTPCLRQPRNLFHVKHSGALTGNRRCPPGLPGGQRSEGWALHRYTDPTREPVVESVRLPEELVAEPLRRAHDAHRGQSQRGQTCCRPTSSGGGVRWFRHDHQPANLQESRSTFSGCGRRSE